MLVAEIISIILPSLPLLIIQPTTEILHGYKGDVSWFTGGDDYNRLRKVELFLASETEAVCKITDFVRTDSSSLDLDWYNHGVVCVRRQKREEFVSLATAWHIEFIVCDKDTAVGSTSFGPSDKVAVIDMIKYPGF